jgi:hypothetical protein
MSGPKDWVCKEAAYREETVDNETPGMSFFKKIDSI